MSDFTAFTRIDLRPLHRRVMDTATAVVAQVPPDRLDLPTPCSEWDLGGLLAHMVGQNYGFAAAADGETEDLSVWADRPVGDDPAGVFAASVERVVSAFAADDLLERSFYLPEVRDGITLPAGIGVSFHFVDYVAHGWEVARSIGVPIEFDDEVLAATLPLAEAVPGGAARTQPGASFGPELATDRDGVLDRVLALLGRSPDWSPARAG